MLKRVTTALEKPPRQSLIKIRKKSIATVSDNFEVAANGLKNERPLSDFDWPPSLNLRLIVIDKFSGITLRLNCHLI